MIAPEKLSKYITFDFGSQGPCSHWFGYYNYSPISADGTKLLSHEVTFDGRDILPEDVADVGWFDLPSGKWHKIATTRAINWQQGSMLQWLGPDYNSRVIFNDVEGEHFCSRIVNVRTGEWRTIPFPVYGVSPDGKFSITLQFERCAWCRAYHYESIRNQAWNVDLPTEDGIFRVDLESGAVTRIISITDIVNLLSPSERKEATGKHWIEHIMLNPDGRRFAFYHRYSVAGGAFYTRAYTADVTGQDIWRMDLPPRSGGSHLGWINGSDFIIYTYSRTALGGTYICARREQKRTLFAILLGLARRVARILIPQKARTRMLSHCDYLHIVDQDKMVERYDFETLSKYGDGHPSFTKDGEWMLTDTYEQPDSCRCLLMVNIRAKRVFELGRFFSPFNSCGYRSDLHPRLSHDEKYVIIDSAHSGKHQIAVYQIDWNGLKAEVTHD